jgi:hypothetical protein
MRINPDNTGLFAPDATTTDPHRDGSKFWAGAHVWIRESDGYARRPITITHDNGTYYEYVEGHVALEGSNNRSNLYLTGP